MGSQRELRKPEIRQGVDDAFRAALDDVAYDNLRALTFWMAAIWVVLLPFPLLRFPLHQAIPLTCVQLADIAIVIAFRIALVRGKIERPWAPAALAALLALPVLDLLVRGVIQYAPDRLIFLELVTLAIGLFCLSLRWLVALLSFGVAAGVILMWLAPGEEANFAGALPLAVAVGIAIVARTTRAEAIAHVERARLEVVKRLAEVRASEAKFRGIVNGIHDVFYRTDLEGTVQMVSPSVTRFGYLPEDLIGTNVRRFYVDPAQHERLVKLLLDKGSVTDFEAMLRRKDGALIVVAASVNLLLDENGQACGFEGLLHDISDRKREEIRSQEQIRETTILARLGRELMRELDTSTLLQRLCQLIVEVFGCDKSHTLLLEGKDAIVAAGWGNTAEQWEALRAMRVPGELLRPWLEEVDQTGVAQFVTSKTEVREFADLASEYGVTQAVYFPLRRGEEMVGLQSIEYCGREDPFSADDVHIARGVMRLASLAFENARLFEQLGRGQKSRSTFFSAPTEARGSCAI
jgi:PAS domain S-box-containing protein